MIIEVFESANDEATIEIEIDNVDVSRVLPFRENVGERIAKEKLKTLLTEVGPIEAVNPDEPENYYAQNVPVWQDGDIGTEKTTLMDIPHHIRLRVVLEGVLQKYGTSDNLQIRIS